jgi:hypothetical protein
MICDVAFGGVAWNRQCKMRNTAVAFERGRKPRFIIHGNVADFLSGRVHPKKIARSIFRMLNHVLFCSFIIFIMHIKLYLMSKVIFYNAFVFLVSEK